MSSSTGSEPAEMNFAPVYNGMDYLASVLDHLGGDPTPRDLKYAVLHLQAATEVLLKALLISHDWKQLFVKPDEADERAFKSGDFKSCDLEALMKRLGEDVVPRPAKLAIRRLAKQRNQLQHFGMTGSAPAVEALAAEVLDFLWAFIDQHLEVSLDADEADHVADQMDQLRVGLGQIKSLVSARLARLKDQLDPVRDRTVQCMVCDCMAFVVDGDFRCLYCGYSVETAEEAARQYVEVVLGISRHITISEGGEDPVERCPDCEYETLVQDVRLPIDPEQETGFCFTCGLSWASMDSCMMCGDPVPATGDFAVCGNCYDYYMTRD